MRTHVLLIILLQKRNFKNELKNYRAKTKFLVGAPFKNNLHKLQKKKYFSENCLKFKFINC